MFLICTQCLLPNVCDQPNEMEDIVTVDVPPPVLPYPPPEQLEDYYFQDVEDAEFDDPPTDELVRYDTGPGLHKWPMRLSCGFLASNFVPQMKR
ncbi:WSSV421 [White spot syndrome virus]|uniref:WSSV421 n=1 Tax=White spot syndrome virus TaxID=342409 RepID=A0A2I6SCC5_9VIRU|nr:WSSV421 [White spot syndrome virus]